MVVTKGLTKVTGDQKCIHVLVEPSPKCTNIFFSGNTSKLIPGGSGVAVVLRNLSGRDVTLEPHTEISMVTAANIVPSMQIPSKQDLVKMRKYNVCLHKKSCQMRLDRKRQNQKISYRRLTYQGLITGILRCNRKLGI